MWNPFEWTTESGTFELLPLESSMSEPPVEHYMERLARLVATKWVGLFDVHPTQRIEFDPTALQ